MRNDTMNTIRREPQRFLLNIHKDPKFQAAVLEELIKDTQLFEEQGICEMQIQAIVERIRKREKKEG
jgi:putative heme iron utilization protein